jgi:energy-coupling factor transporter ATP-binding protein EcfA2
MAELDRYIHEVPDENIRVLSRKTFVQDFGADYQPGQHVTFLGPSGRGKTQLAGQLALAVRAYHPEMRFVILHGKIKGRDRTIERLSKNSGFPIVSRWPPRGLRDRYRLRQSHGAVLRPLEHPGKNIREENVMLRAEYERAIHRSYHAPHKHPVVVIADEAHQTHNDLQLRHECEGPLMRGRPVCSMWSLVQRGRYVLATTYTIKRSMSLSSTIRTETINAGTQKSGT